jgi:hypothetical protein
LIVFIIGDSLDIVFVDDLERNVMMNAKMNATHAVLATSESSIVSIDLSIVDALSRNCVEDGDRIG